MNAPRTEALIRKRGEVRDHALYELALELENRVNELESKFTFDGVKAATLYNRFNFNKHSLNIEELTYLSLALREQAIFNRQMKNHMMADLYLKEKNEVEVIRKSLLTNII